MAIPYVPAFNARVVEADGARFVEFSGECDIAATEQASAVLASVVVAPRATFTVDVSRVTFMDASGLTVLLRAHKQLRAERDGRIAVRGASAMLRRIFEITGLAGLLADTGSASLEEVLGPELSEELDNACREAEWSVRDLFVAYFALGGTADIGRVVALVRGDGDALDGRQRDIAVHAVNERLNDLGRADRLLSYRSG
jgi:anti-anti-sigma factor